MYVLLSVIYKDLILHMYGICTYVCMVYVMYGICINVCMYVMYDCLSLRSLRRKCAV